jgi:hypothetical protein
MGLVLASGAGCGDIMAAAAFFYRRRERQRSGLDFIGLVAREVIK